MKIFVFKDAKISCNLREGRRLNPTSYGISDSVLKAFLRISEPFIHIFKSFYPSKTVFKKLLQQKKTDGEKWAQNNFANGLAQE